MDITETVLNECCDNFLHLSITLNICHRITYIIHFSFYFHSFFLKILVSCKVDVYEASGGYNVRSITIKPTVTGKTILSTTTGTMPRID